MCSVFSTGIVNSVHPKTVVFGFKRSAISVQLSAKGLQTKDLADPAEAGLKAVSRICFIMDGH